MRGRDGHVYRILIPASVQTRKTKSPNLFRSRGFQFNNLALFWRDTYPKLKQQLPRRYPKQDWRERALIHTQKAECPLFFPTNLTTLIDGQGLRRVDYYGDKWLEKEVLKDLRRLAGEK